MLDPTKPVQTRDGRKAKILCTDFKGHDATGTRPILAVIEEMYGVEKVISYPLTGRKDKHDQANSEDLVNIPREEVMYGIVWRKTQTFGNMFFTTEVGRDSGFDAALGLVNATPVKVLVKEIE